MGGGGKKGGGSKIVTVTYTYEVKSAIVFSWGPIDTFLRLDVNDKFHIYNVRRGGTQSWTETTPGDESFWFFGAWLNQNTGTTTTVTHLAADYLVLEEGDTIKSGNIYFGTDTQSADPLLDASIGHYGASPTYRKVAYCAVHWDLGSQPSIPTVSFTFARYYCACPGVVKHVVDPDGGRGINPSHALYDLLTSPYYGYGLSADLIDTQSFVDASSILYDEGVGIGHILATGEVHSSVRAMLDWIDGEIVYNEGLISLVLRRKDYTIEELTVFTERDIKARTFSVTRPSWFVTKNVVYVNFLDVQREHDQNAVYREDLANIVMTGTTRVQEFNFDMHTNTATAQRVCSRLLHQQSYPYLVVEFECFAKGADLKMFKPFILRHSYYGVNHVFRVIEKIKQGPNLWKVQAFEEQVGSSALFSLLPEEIDHPQYWEPSYVEWDVRMVENPYRGLLALPYSLTPITFKAGCVYNWQTRLKPGMEWYATSPLDKVLFKLDLDADGEADWADEKNYASVGTLTNYLGPNEETDTQFEFIIDFHYQFDYTDLSYILIDDEFMSVASVTPDGEDLRKYTAMLLTRGIECSSTASHAIGARVFNVECRALALDEVACTYDWRDPNPTLYNFECVPHYLLAKPHYSEEGTKWKLWEYRNYLGRPLGFGYKTYTSYIESWVTDMYMHVFYDSRVGVTVQPCPPLKPYRRMTANYCPLEDRYVTLDHVTYCGEDDSKWQSTGLCDFRWGYHAEFWLWDSTFEWDGDIYYFNAWASAPSDPYGVWISDAYAFDYPEGNYAVCGVAGHTYQLQLDGMGGANYTNYLDGTGVNCEDYGDIDLDPVSGKQKELKYRVWAKRLGSTYSVVRVWPTGAADIQNSNIEPCVWGLPGKNYGADGGLIGTNGEGVDEYGGFWSPWTVLNGEPSGGWTWSFIKNSLGCRIWVESLPGATAGTNLEVGVGRVEVFIPSDMIVRPAQGIVGDSPVYSMEVDYNYGEDKLWSYNTQTLIDAGMTVGYMIRMWEKGYDAALVGWQTFDAYHWWTGSNWVMLTHMWEDPFYNQQDPDQWAILPFDWYL